MPRALLLVLALSVPALAGGFEDSFEEDLNSDGIPDGWYRYQDPTHPLYNPILPASDHAHVRDRDRSVLLETRGGSVSLVSAVPGPLLPTVDPRRGYSFTVWAMTEGLATSRAYATVQWLDRIGEPLPLPPQKTNALGGTSRWTELAARFETVPATARFARFGLHIDGSDLSGKAFFDGLVWREEVRIRVEDLAHAGFVVPEGKAARIETRCEDLEIGEYEVALWAHEHDGRDVPLSISQEGTEWRIAMGSGDGTAHHAARVGRSRDFRARYRIEGIPTGFLELVLSIRQEGKEVARRRVGLLSLPQALRTPSLGSEWGVELTPFTDPEVVDRLAQLHLGRACVLFWTDAPDREAELAKGGAIDELLYRLTRSGHTIGGALSSPPAELLPEGATQAGMAQYLSGPQASWAPALISTFSRYRETIQEWRLGGTGDRGYRGNAGLDDLARTVAAGVGRELPGLSFTFPLAADEAPNGIAQLSKASALKGIDFYLPGNYEEATAKGILQAIATRQDASVLLGLEELATGDASESWPLQAAALWRAAGLATHAGVRRFSVTPLVSYRAGLYDLEGTPTPLLGAFWALHGALRQVTPVTDARPLVHRVPPGEAAREIEQLVFRRESTHETLVLAWLADDGPPLSLPVYLGHSVRELRVDGRSEPLREEADGETRVTLRREPVLLYGIDTELFETLRTVTFVPPRVVSKSGPQQVKLQFENKFAVPLSIRDIEIEFPKYWKAESTRLDQVAPQATGSVDVSIVLPESQTVDPADVRVRMSFKAEEEYRGLLVQPKFEVVSESGVDLSVEPRWKGQVLEVEVRVTNGGDRPSGYVVAVALGEGIPVQTDVTGTIAAHGSWKKVWRFPGSDDLVGREVRVKLNEPRATTFLSKTKRVPRRP